MHIPFPINQLIPAGSEDFIQIHRIVDENKPLIAQLSGAYKTDHEVRSILCEITQSKIDDTLVVNLPLFCDFGRHIRIGKNVFINTAVMFTDLGGITLEDNVLIGPRVNLISVNHPLDPADRRGVILAPIRICKNAWIGANATILPGVTVGENAVVAAGAVVTQDVAANTVVGGIPAKVIKSLHVSNEF